MIILKSTKFKEVNKMIKTVEEGLEVYKKEVKDLVGLEKSLENLIVPFPAVVRSEIRLQKIRIEGIKTALGLSNEEVEKIKKKILKETQKEV